MAAICPVDSPMESTVELCGVQIPEDSVNPAVSSPAVKPEIPPPASQIDNTVHSPVIPTVVIPSYSRWFSWNSFHECEMKHFPEFFDGTSPSKRPDLYKYYRNSIVQAYRKNPANRITFTEVRRTLVGDVGSILRLFDFLESWGLINYSGPVSKQPLKWEDKDSKSVTGSTPDSCTPQRAASKNMCGGCKTQCCIACFYCEKSDLTLCARCYVRGNYRAGVTSSDFRRVEISEESDGKWSDMETMRLLEAVTHYGEDWKKVAEHVGSRNQKECIACFLRLPYGERFLGDDDTEEVGSMFNPVSEPMVGDDADCMENTLSLSQKRARLTPLADASNPIMAQVAFLAAVAGDGIAKAAAEAAVTALGNELGGRKSGNLTTTNAITMADPEDQVHKTAKFLDSSTQKKINDIRERIQVYEEVEMEMEKEWRQLRQMEDFLFTDRISLASS